MRRFTVQALALYVGAFAVLALPPSEAGAQGAVVTNQTRQALGFYGGRSAINTLS